MIGMCLLYNFLRISRQRILFSTLYLIANRCIFSNQSSFPINYTETDAIAKNVIAAY